MTPRAASLRLGGSLLALAAGAAGVVVVVALLRSVPGPLGSAPAILGAPGAPPAAGPPGGEIATPTDPGFPAPPPGAIVLAREAGDYALALAIVRGAPRSLVRVSVVSPEGPGAAGFHVSVSFGAQAPLSLHPCGAGCYQATLRAGVARQVVVRLRGRSYGFTLPARRVPQTATAIVAHAAAIWRALKTLVWHERLAGSPTEVIHTVYIAVAPDELEYTIRGISQALIIGATRWDREKPGGPWLRSAQLPIHMPLPFWYGVSDARMLGSGRIGGSSVWKVSFFDPTTPAWFEAEIDKRSGRTLELSMITASHFMYDVYGPFNTVQRLRPPTAGE